MKAIFFDFFGVLAAPFYSPIIRQRISETGQLEWVKKIDSLDLGSLSESDFVKELSKQVGLPESAVSQGPAGAPQINQELFDFIQSELQGKYTLGLLTNAPRSLIDRLAAERLQHFDIVIVSSDVHLVKPDPRIFELAIQRAGCQPSDILFIDDGERNVTAAQEAGLQGLVYTDFASFKAQLKTKLSGV
jgi:HAD superfamily hydrolase (TIGR01509 family)